MPEVPDLDQVFSDYDRGSFQLMRGLPGYDYLLFLRHNGFPSPLLDWSRSPYVAAFFALREPLDVGEDDPAIHVLVPTQKTISYGVTDPAFKRTGEYVTTHNRHYLQQSDYTVCMTFNLEENFWSFSSQDEFLKSSGNRTYKLVTARISKSARDGFLKNLDRFNLNAYSLFGTPDTLAETLSFRVFEGARPATHPMRPRKFGDL